MNIQPIILAAGKGSRMMSSVPKVLMPIAGKPIIQHLIDNLSKTPHTTKPIVVVGENFSDIERELGTTVSYAHQKQQLGTGHALKSALPHVTHARVLVLYGDHPLIQPATLSAFTSVSHTSHAIGTVRVPHYLDEFDLFNHWGRVIRDENQKVNRITEFKDATETEKKVLEVNASPYYFETKWLRKNIHTLTSTNAQSEFYITDLVQCAVSQNISIQTIPIPPEQAIGINTKEQLNYAEKYAELARNSILTPS